MELSGTLDSFALPDVLRLLASTKKTGRLRVTGDRCSGSVWVDDGEVVSTELTARGTIESGPADVVFALLRFGSGSFTFEAGATAVNATQPEPLEPVLAAAERMLVEWRAIEEVVPSLDVFATLMPEPAGGDVMIDTPRWRCIAAVGGGATAGAVGETLGQSELEVCRNLKELVDLGLVEIAGAPPEHHIVPAELLAAPVFESREIVEPISDFEAPMPSPEDEEHEPDALLPDPDIGSEDTDTDTDDDSLPEIDGASDIFDEDLSEGDGSTVEEMDLDLAPVVTAAPGLAGLSSEADFDPEPGPDDGPTMEEPTELEPENESGRAALFGGPSTAEEAASNLDVSEMARQLANLSPKAAKAVAAAAKASTDAERDEALATVEAEDDTLNRGLLLKFLGSVET